MVVMDLELVGNALCLDFANTVNQRVEPVRDRLAEPDGLRSWAEAAGLPRPSRRPTDADRIDAVALRDAVYRIFAAVASDERPAPRDTTVVNRLAAEGLGTAVYAAAGPAYTVRWKDNGPRRVLWAVADSAVELLRHGPLDRVGECPSCGWVFLDTSRNGRRRWCSMTMCGGAVKSARHYERTRSSGR